MPNCPDCTGLTLRRLVVSCQDSEDATICLDGDGDISETTSLACPNDDEGEKGQVGQEPEEHNPCETQNDHRHMASPRRSSPLIGEATFPPRGCVAAGPGSEQDLLLWIRIAVSGAVRDVSFGR